MWEWFDYLVLGFERVHPRSVVQPTPTFPPHLV